MTKNSVLVDTYIVESEIFEGWTEKYRVMVSNENGDNFINLLLKSRVTAFVFYDNQTKNPLAKEVVLDRVFFDKSGEYMLDKDENIMIWRDEEK